MRRSPILLPVLMVASLVVGQRIALAQPPEYSGHRTERVGYADLDLTTPSGVAMLDRRIAQAINRVCNRGDVRDLGSMSEERRCRSEARLAANSQRTGALASANPGPVQFSSRR